MNLASNGIGQLTDNEVDDYMPAWRPSVGSGRSPRSGWVTPKINPLSALSSVDGLFGA
jgi:hypothetical protein